MKNKVSRRIVPISAVTVFVFVVLVVFEMLVIGGAIQFKASTVAKIAPWAYEPFLKLIGEHPDSAAHRTNQDADTSGSAPSAMELVSRFDADALLGETNAVPDPTTTEIPAATEKTISEPEQEPPATNKPEQAPKEAVPVG